MKVNIFYFVLFFNFLFIVNPVVQKWNFENSSIDLLGTSESMTFKVFDETKDGINIQLYKIISKEDGSIIYTNNLKINNGITFDGEVNFDRIESFYYLMDKVIVCPKGKFHPIFFYENKYSHFNITNFEEKGDWELKCYYHLVGFFLVFYLNNANNGLYYKNIYQGLQPNTYWEKTVIRSGIYDFKLNNIDEVIQNDHYDFTYIGIDGGWIKIIESECTIRQESPVNIADTRMNDCNFNILIHSRGCFQNNYENFFIFTYSTISDFTSEYGNITNHGNYLSIGQIKKFSESPLEFLDDVEIEKMNFIDNNKYIYYSIFNKNLNKRYHGIMDIMKNLVIFNTE